MDQADCEMWFAMVDKMIRRLEALQAAMEGGVHHREPPYAIEDSEVQVVDRVGYELLQQCVAQKSAVLRVWHFHSSDRCCTVHASITKMRQNRALLHLLLRSATPLLEQP
jgi:hypothetical protein